MTTHRSVLALCLAASLLALGTSAVALLLEPASLPAREPRAEAQGVERLERILDTVEERLSELERRVPAAERDAGSAPAGAATSGLPPPAAEAGLADGLQALASRVAALEDEKTIARLAKMGEERYVEEELRESLQRISDPGTSPESRLEALRSIRGRMKTYGAAVKTILGEAGIDERDILGPVLDLARDTSLPAKLRIEALDHVAGSKSEEFRGPLLELLVHDEIPEVRGGAAQALMSRIEDAEVRDAIRTASRADPDPGVRRRAESYLPKLDHFDRLAVEGGASAPGGAK